VRGGRDAAMGRLWFEVMDTGCGMDDATAARVFESFEQATAATAREHGGTGLGLAISRRLAELMGGSLTVDSRAGEGSTFRLEIPLVEMNVAEAPSVPGSLGHGDAGGVHILVAEDHAVNQRIVRLILEPLGIRLTVVDNGAEAVQAAATQPFDAILMDMQMPVMDGVEATRRILASPGPNRCTPVVALTANALAEHRAQWAEVGVTHFVAKPVNMQSLVDVVMQTTAARREVERAREADGCVAQAHIVPMVALQGLSAGRR
jgi:CheY-like chemotaxis protein